VAGRLIRRPYARRGSDMKDSPLEWPDIEALSIVDPDAPGKT
jgi:hypothetical protein